jgi:hypothetical protein
VGGNYNNVESIKDRSQGYFGNTTGGKECNKWNAFLVNLGMMDAWNLKKSKRIGNKKFTWYKKSPTPIWSHLDKFYVDVYIQQHGGRVRIWSIMAHISNHFSQIFLKTHKSLVQMRFNLQLLQLNIPNNIY